MIYDPANPPLIFDGQLDVYSTCRDCGETMKVITPDQHSHPGCVIVETELESLRDLWASERLRNEHEQMRHTEELIANIRDVEIAEHAVTFTQWGWPVFPLGKRSKQPAIPKAKGGTGFKQATTDTERIRRWWTRHPQHNIGVATGHTFDVIDVDTKDSKGNPSSAGIMSLMKLLSDKDLPTCHGVAVTASGGLHLYVKKSGKGNYGALRPGIDYRGLGGYVVVPPSLLEGKGREYVWLVEPSPTIKVWF